MNNIAIAFIFGSVAFVFLFLYLSIFNYKKRFHQSYDLRNHYPYELNFESKFKDNLYGNIGVVLFGINSILFYTLFDLNHINGYFIFTMIAGVIYSLALVFLAFVPLKLFKSHILTALLAVVLSFLIPFSNALACVNDYKASNNTSSLVMMIFNVVYCLFVFILMMNPKLSHWADLKEEKNPDGTVKYVRPKYFLLAFYEWLLILSSFLLMILTLLTRYFVI